ncbi:MULTISPECIES: heat shock protein transcriptional repressor HspR [Catellatospora]|uniref:MerR family transcriptional regulator n=2 Tax=Catellatospora TaxID=53365 RepID=A0A8J3KTW6_9ACTN|nr:MerR family transcriptional regulator/heat shock protein HspR [Catellatospora citrea]GIF88743.1 MerR family transcriptional regulator [Catellatospora chokoriensis]GIG01870.1 MerR family transcriptional regulator [Catellatospora citrea]
MDEQAKVLLISVAAQLAGMHPQTLRQYDRMGLVEPGRSAGGGRRYSLRDVELLREIQRLSQEEGVSLAGVKRIIDLERLVLELRERLEQAQQQLAYAERRLAQLETISAFPRTDLLPSTRTSTALVVWRPRSAEA